jgi:hypothetical protein
VSFVIKRTASVSKLFNLKLRFQNEYNKVKIALRVVQFCSEIKLVITNRSEEPGNEVGFAVVRLCNHAFDQVALHSVQLPLLINQILDHVQYMIASMLRRIIISILGLVILLIHNLLYILLPKCWAGSNIRSISRNVYTVLNTKIQINI